MDLVWNFSDVSGSVWLLWFLFIFCRVIFMCDFLVWVWVFW